MGNCLPRAKYYHIQFRHDCQDCHYMFDIDNEKLIYNYTRLAYSSMKEWFVCINDHEKFHMDYLVKKYMRPLEKLVVTNVSFTTPDIFHKLAIRILHDRKYVRKHSIPRFVDGSLCFSWK